jgi:type II secretory pathway pseudopilin PulG
MIELMIVISIVAIIAAIGVPNYGRYKRRAQQGEAKTLLGAINAHEAIFYYRWQQYTTDLNGIGVSPTGPIIYRAGFSGSRVWGSGMANLSYDGGPLNGARNNTGLTSVCLPGRCNYIGSAGVSGSVLPSGTGAAAQYRAAGCANLGGAMADCWIIDQAKQLRNTQDGTL